MNLGPGGGGKTGMEKKKIGGQGKNTLHWCKKKVNREKERWENYFQTAPSTPCGGTAKKSPGGEVRSGGGK